MSKTAKIITGLGVLAGISYLGNKRLGSQRAAARAGGFFGYLKGMGQGFYSGVKTILRVQT